MNNPAVSPTTVDQKLDDFFKLLNGTDTPGSVVGVQVSIDKAAGFGTPTVHYIRLRTIQHCISVEGENVADAGIDNKHRHSH